MENNSILLAAEQKKVDILQKKLDMLRDAKNVQRNRLYDKIKRLKAKVASEAYYKEEYREKYLDLQATTSDFFTGKYQEQMKRDIIKYLLPNSDLRGFIPKESAIRSLVLSVPIPKIPTSESILKKVKE